MVFTCKHLITSFKLRRLYHYRTSHSLSKFIRTIIFIFIRDTLNTTFKPKWHHISFRQSGFKKHEDSMRRKCKSNGLSEQVLVEKDGGGKALSGLRGIDGVSLNIMIQHFTLHYRMNAIMIQL